MPGKLFYTCFLITTVFCLSCCSSSDAPNNFSADKLNETPLFHFNRIDLLDESPIGAPEFLNRIALKKLGIAKVTIYSKGGKNPEDTLEKMVYSYSGDYKTMNFTFERFDENPVLWSKGKLILDSLNNGSANFARYFGINKASKSKFVSSDNEFLIVKTKRNNRHDTVFYYRSFENPKAIVERIGGRVLSVELFLPSGSSSKNVKNAFSELSLDNSSINFAQCSVTFTNNGKPMESYLLNEQFSQVNLLKDWNYDNSGRLTEFSEWNGTNQLKNIIIHYSDNAVPDYFSINKRTYYIHYN